MKIKQIKPTTKTTQLITNKITRNFNMVLLDGINNSNDIL